MTDQERMKVASGDPQWLLDLILQTDLPFDHPNWISPRTALLAAEKRGREEQSELIKVLEEAAEKAMILIQDEFPSHPWENCECRPCLNIRRIKKVLAQLPKETGR